MRLLKSDRLTLRPVEPTDVDVILSWENDTEAWVSSSTSAPYSRRMIDDYVAGYRADLYGERQLRLVIENNGDGTAAGLIDLYDYDPANRHAMTGIYVAPHMRGAGIGREALELLADYARRHVYMHRLAALVAGDNRESRAMFAAAGYVESARLPEWFVRRDGFVDGYIYTLAL